MTSYIEKKALRYELQTLVILPVISTLAWELAVYLKYSAPFMGSLIVMVALNYAALAIHGWYMLDEKSLQTRILVDSVLVGLTIMIGNATYLKDGLKVPTGNWKEMPYTFAGILCVMATTRGCTFLLMLLQSTLKLDFR